MRWDWSGDCDRFLANLPSPLFRMADAYDVADRVGIERVRVQGIWYRLRIAGRIIRTKVPIGKSSSRRYWTRSWCSVKTGPPNKHIIALLTKCQR